MKNYLQQDSLPNTSAPSPGTYTHDAQLLLFNPGQQLNSKQPLFSTFSSTSEREKEERFTGWNGNI